MIKQPCILILEPDTLARHPLAEYLRECGYRVLEAASADEARQLFTQGSITINIVLADVDTPGGSVFAFATWLRSAFPAVDLILAGTLATATEKAGDLCEEGPALSKPYDHRFVLERIRQLRAAHDRAQHQQSRQGFVAQ